ncbi:pre-mRNA-splicing factor ISY1 homolog [Sabethes cyaneus]|uniref:pre-mRNA-splicing factor ISY1 homolog n=1 Tax=Sabethes cyaneus TaxID=53552 RepID=UPI00237E1F89|nr:pre-mRNA-splicing factor ISY1 homolog [Sabethes cyaneus]
MEVGKSERRPQTASELREMARYVERRLETIEEITKKIAQIQNVGLGDQRIRELNDEINKLLGEKRHLEDRISDLGGRTVPASFEYEGREVPAKPGSLYFGAAKQLPGVREQLFVALPKNTRPNLMGDIDSERAIKKIVKEFKDEMNGAGTALTPAEGARTRSIPDEPMEPTAPLGFTAPPDQKD